MAKSLIQRKWVVYAAILCLVVVLSSCSLFQDDSSNENEQSETSTNQTTEQTGGLNEDKSIYNNDNNDVVHLYVTVLADNRADLDKGTLDNLNHWYDFYNITENGPQLDIVVQEGDASGPKGGFLGVNSNAANATFEIRGASGRRASQKSYKIKLLDSAGRWQGQSTINLNKHMYDFTRIRNKLSFDLMKKVPNLTSLRTQFVQLHIKDLTSDTNQNKYVDYGLYTHVEQPNKTFLASHGLNSEGQLYKATNFEFNRYSDIIKLTTDEGYDRDLFETILEIKGSEDHQKLIDMLDAVNNTNMGINEVIDKYFDRENYLTWLGINILFGNLDTVTQNFYLYSPINEEKFYFLPWDYDAAWDWEKESLAETTATRNLASWQVGASDYWSIPLHKRFLKDPSNVKDLEKKIDELAELITKEDIKSLLDTYYPVVYPYVSRNPDLAGLPLKLDQYDAFYWRLENIVEQNKERFYQSLENPMPVFLGDMTKEDNKYVFTWDYSYDLQNDDIYYNFEISKTPDFTDVVYRKENMQTNSIQVEGIASGVYYWRVIVKDAKGNQQEAFDIYYDQDNNMYFGEKRVSIN